MGDPTEVGDPTARRSEGDPTEGDLGEGDPTGGDPTEGDLGGDLDGRPTGGGDPTEGDLWGGACPEVTLGRILPGVNVIAAQRPERDRGGC